MRHRSRWSGRRPDRTSAGDAQQPGSPPREARLLDVRQQDGQVVVVLEGGLTLEIAPGSVPAALPDIGQVASASVVAELEAAAERKKVARLVFAMLDRRLQPVARIRRKLTDKGYSVEAVDHVLEQMAAQGLHSDRRYAEAFCRDCLLNRAVGRRYLVSKLREKQVSGTLAAEVVDALLDESTENDLAHRAARGRWRRQARPAEPNSLAKVVRYLQGRGFAASIAYRAARAERPESDEPTLD